MDLVDATYIITLPNSDPGQAEVRAMLVAAANKPRRAAVEALGERRFWGLLKIADAVLGNSSSAMIEAPALGVPAVNVGDRQKGRIRSASVLDVTPEGKAVAVALRSALTDEFRAIASRAPGPFGDGHSADRIGAVLSSWTPPSPPVKKRHKVPS